MVSRGKLKIIFAGESGTGKSSLVIAMQSENKCRETLGVDISSVTIQIDGQDVSLEMWDTGGHERFQAITQSYYRNALGVVLVYDISNRTSFIRIESWLTQIKMFATCDDIVIILVGNKIDKDVREVSRDEGLAFAKQHNILFIETSALKNEFVSHMFEKLARKILRTHHVPQIEALEVKLSSEPKKTQSGGCC